MIRFHPHPGEVLFCGFPEPGTQPHAPPEIVKRRRVVILSRRDENVTRTTLLVVPLSTQEPDPLEPFHYRLQTHYPFLGPAVWVKGDLVAHVAIARLDRVFVQRTPIRAYLTPDDFTGVRSAVLHAMGLADLTIHLRSL